MTSPVSADERLAFVNFVRLWWRGPNGFPVVPAGSQAVADEDYEDMERDLAAIGLRVVSRSQPPDAGEGLPKGLRRDPFGQLHPWPSDDYEAQPPDAGEGLDVERLARAIANVIPTGTKYPERLAAEYAALTPKPEEPA